MYPTYCEIAHLLIISLNGILKLNEVWPLEGATMYTCTYLYGRILGGIPIMLVLCNFLRKLMVSNKKIHRALRTHTTLIEQYPLEKFFIFTIYQNYTLALMFCNAHFANVSPVILKSFCKKNPNNRNWKAKTELCQPKSLENKKYLCQIKCPTWSTWCMYLGWNFENFKFTAYSKLY